ncbi:MAG: hypothetical protein E7635_03545 [Ruminococcaceae bacterium]|nr:hypothetical protein [Oscillospiraceae bacterium]
MNIEPKNSAHSEKTVKITRSTVCEHFMNRQCLLKPITNCWFCKYACFKELKSGVPEVGVCKYPIKQTN